MDWPDRSPSVGLAAALRALLFVALGGQLFQKIVEHMAGLVESPVPDNAAPVIFDFGDPNRRVGQGLLATIGRDDQLRATVARVGDALQIAKVFEFVDQL